MEPTKTGISTAAKVAAALIIIIMLAIASFSVLTYPSTVVSFSVSFTIGASTQEKTFTIQAWDNAADVQIGVSSGSALWSGSIINSNETTAWNHRAAQGEQTIYSSGWVALPSGTYNFTFGTIGAGSLNADVAVEAKGGFW